MQISSLPAYGSHLHLHDMPGLYLRPDNILSHPPMGIMEQVIAQISQSKLATASSSHATGPTDTEPARQLLPGAAARAAHQSSRFRR